MLTDEVNGGFVRIVFRRATGKTTDEGVNGPVNGPVNGSVNGSVNGPVNEKIKEKIKEKSLDKVYRLISDAYVGRNCRTNWPQASHSHV